jgi:putative aldouronate transport system substrate-binding protein
MKKITVLFLTLMVFCLASLFAGGTSQEAQSGGQPSASGPVKLSVAITEDLRIQDYETNYMTGILERDANVNLDFVLFPSTDYVNKLNLMVMAGGAELPDIIINGPGDAIVYQWAREGAIIPLTKYFKDPKLSPWTHDAIKRTGVDILAQITSPDGEIYGFPQLNQSYGNEYPDKVFYYEPWLTKLGIKVPETTEEYRTALRTAVTKDPNGNGKTDEQGITGLPPMGDWFRFLMNSFVDAGGPNQLRVDNGKVSAAYTAPEWREGLKYIRSLFAEGLIPMENLTQDRAQANTILNSPEVRTFSFVYYSPSQISASNSAGDRYTSGPPLKGPGGIRYATFLPSVASIQFMVSANCKNPDAAARVGDLMERADIGIITRFGQEGVDWDYPQNAKNLAAYSPYQEGFPISIVMYDDFKFWGGTTVSNASWRQKGPYVRNYAVANGRGVIKDTVTHRSIMQGKTDAMYQNSGWAPKEVIPKLIYNEEETNMIQDIRTSLNNYVLEMTSAFLAGNRDIDASWNAYVAELNNIGLAKFLSVNQTVYDRMYKSK